MPFLCLAIVVISLAFCSNNLFFSLCFFLAGMGVRGLQSFMERCCPEACVTVDLREMARQHVARNQQGRPYTHKIKTELSFLYVVVVAVAACVLCLLKWLNDEAKLAALRPYCHV